MTFHHLVPSCFASAAPKNTKIPPSLGRSPPSSRNWESTFTLGDFDPGPLVQEFGSPPNLKILGRLSDEELGAELSAATCLLFPSRIEGFGIPAVEAMALGCPVVTSSAACLPEVCGDAALYADPDRPDDWVTAVALLHRDAALRENLKARGLERVKRYSWRRIAEQYLEMMAR
jgi:glycosyltransferase involved in cell wall biosynthesis